MSWDICPVCGWLYALPEKTCVKCGAQMHTVKTKYDMSHYKSEATRLYGSPRYSRRVLIDTELSKNPHYNPELARRVREEADRERNQKTIHPNVLRKIAELEEEEHKANNDPKCPTCGSYNVKRISHMRRAAHAMTIGILSTTARSQFECLSCSYKW